MKGVVMPLVTISMLKKWSNNEKQIISDSIHMSLVEAFKIPNDDYNHRILEIEKCNFYFPENKTENYMIIEMTIFPGRSINAKKQLYQEISVRLSKIGINENDILVVLNEPIMENWGIRGKPGNEIELGFNLKV
jgi:phenylpyruvate tautomerase PptA (4-oxalocrotonate tautomerase family)